MPVSSTYLLKTYAAPVRGYATGGGELEQINSVRHPQVVDAKSWTGDRLLALQIERQPLRSNKTMQKVMWIGNLGRDPEVKYSQQGTAIVQCSIATTERWKNKSGELQEHGVVRRQNFGGPLAKQLFRTVRHKQ